MTEVTSDDAGGAIFGSLPLSRTQEGASRRVGVEIEFAGLDEARTAELVRDHLGGTVTVTGDHARHVEDTALGGIEIVLDTALRRYGGNALVNAGLDAVRGLIPVEIVTEPLDPAGLARLDAFRETLRQAGATGTEDGLLLGHGVHFNIEVVTFRSVHTRRTIVAFALLEQWLRALDPIDPTRRVLPFVDPWPVGFLDALLATGPDPGLDRIFRLYADHCNSRNYALDLLPLLRFSDDALFESLFPAQTNTGARPAFHYRLPDCRIDAPDWTLAREWDRWWLVEALAATPDLLDILAADRADRPRTLLGDGGAWVEQVTRRLGPRGEVLRGGDTPQPPHREP